MACPSGSRFPDSLNARRVKGPTPAGAAPRVFDASLQFHDLLPTFRLCEVRHLHTDHDRRRRAEPPTRCRVRHTEVRGDRQIPSALDEVPEPMVIGLLRRDVVDTPDDHRPFADAAQLLNDDSEASVAVMTTHARKCNLSVGTAGLSLTAAVAGVWGTSRTARARSTRHVISAFTSNMEWIPR